MLHAKVNNIVVDGAFLCPVLVCATLRLRCLSHHDTFEAACLLGGIKVWCICKKNYYYRITMNVHNCNIS